MFLNSLLSVAFNPKGFLEALPYMGFGMLGIFIVMGVIILVMTIMGKIESAIEKKKQEKASAEVEEE